MLGVYLQLSIRNLLRNKLFTVINLVGLAMAMSIGLVVISIIVDLMMFDNFHERKDGIYRVITDVKYPLRDISERAACPLPVANELRDNFADLGVVTQIQKQFTGTGLANRKEIAVNGYFADSEFFEVFTFPFLQGRQGDALSRPNTMVVTSTLANKFFGNRNPMGEVVSVTGLGEYIITGVIKDPPKNSHLNFEALASISSLSQLEARGVQNPSLDNWSEFHRTYVYVSLTEGVSREQLDRSLDNIEILANRNNQGLSINFKTQSLAKIVPGPDLSSQLGLKMGYLPLAIMTIVVFLIIGSACINYANLSLALSLRKAREVGIRKILGSTKAQLFIKFLAETLFISILALLISVAIFYFIRTEVLSIIPRAKDMLNLSISPLLLLSFLSLAIITGVLAGVLPAAILSSMEIISSLKNTIAKGSLRGARLRKALIVFQFTLSLFLIIGIVVVYRQYEYSIAKDLGFKKENTLVVPLKSSEYLAFKNTFEQLPDISSIAASSEPIGSYQTRGMWLRTPDRIDSIEVNYMAVDEKFITDLEIELLSGNLFTTTTSANEIIVNERFVRMVNKRPHEIISDELQLGTSLYRVRGVVRDFHYMHLEESIRPLCFIMQPSQVRYAYLQLKEDKFAEIKPVLESYWKKVNAEESFEPVFLEDALTETYRFYTDFVKLFGFIAFLAISIGCLGLIGMTLYSAESRIKEIGIRKVMGANEGSLIYLLSRSFAVLLIISCMIAVPLGYLAFNELVSVSAYHISIGVVELGTGVALFLLVGIPVVVSQTLSTARTNPADVLRVE